MGSFFVNFMPQCAYIWSLAFYCFYDRLSQDYKSGDPRISLFTDTSKNYTISSLVIGGVLCLITSVCFIYLGNGENAALKNKNLYSERVLSFLTDYDKENPVTNK